MPYIDRDMAIKALINEERNVDSRYLESERIIHESDAIEAISMLPTADVVERKVGKWVQIRAESWECSICHKENCYAYRYNDYLSDRILQDYFCPNCGADMREEDGAK